MVIPWLVHQVQDSPFQGPCKASALSAKPPNEEGCTQGLDSLSLEHLTAYIQLLVFVCPNSPCIWDSILWEQQHGTKIFLPRSHLSMQSECINQDLQTQERSQVLLFTYIINYSHLFYCTDERKNYLAQLKLFSEPVPSDIHTNHLYLNTDIQFFLVYLTCKSSVLCKLHYGVGKQWRILQTPCMWLVCWVWKVPVVFILL